MNQYSSNHQPSHTLWYTPTPQKPFPFVYHSNLNHINNNNNYDDVDSDNSTTNANNMVDPSETASSSTITTLDKEHMFEKPLTPSDVGKLNRLVIPKQHAEKYLPLAAAANAASDGGAGGGGLLLGFEDETGKCWRFRYSYWNSSQSYVLTKGWSRYVKEKKLDAGDVVLFERHRFEPDRFFIGWRRRGSNPPVQPTVGWAGRSSSSSYNFNINNNHNQNHQGYNNNNNNNYSYNNNSNSLQHNVVQSQQSYAASHQISAFTNFLPQGKVDGKQKSKKSGNSKRVRLFGVNLECQLEEDDENIIDDEPQTSDGSSLSSQGQGQVFGWVSGSGSRMGPTSYNYIDYVGYPPNNHDHMDMNFSHDINMRNRLG